MFIGEAPGRDEDRIGKPFVGRAGQLLDKMLASIGLDRTTNCLHHQCHQLAAADNRDPSPEEAAICLPFLRRHIELVNPGSDPASGRGGGAPCDGHYRRHHEERGRWLEYRVGSAWCR